jgi:hypothetical protein
MSWFTFLQTSYSNENYGANMVFEVENLMTVESNQDLVSHILKLYLLCTFF